MLPSVSFLILDYFKAEKVLKNISGILSQDYSGDIEIIIGDNSESQENKKILEKGIEKLKKEIEKNQFLYSRNIHFLHFQKNVGYSKGNNALAEKSQGEYLCIVNPDIEWNNSQTLKTLIEYQENNEEVGIVAPRQKELSGKEALSIRAFPSFFTQIARRTLFRKISPFLEKVEKDEMQHINRNKTQEVDWVQSSFLVIHKDLWKNLDGFDESYFLFLADTQLCKDAWKMNKKVVHFADVTVYSDGIRCSEGGFFSFFISRTLQIHVLDSLKYFWKHFFFTKYK